MSDDSSAGRKILTTILIVIVCAVFVTAVVVGWFWVWRHLQPERWLRSGNLPQTEKVPSSDQIARKNSRKPLPFNVKTPSENGEEEAYGWFQTNVVSAYRKVGRRSEKWDEQAIAFLDLATTWDSGIGSGPNTQTVVSSADELLKVGCDDPAVLYFAALAKYRLRKHEIFEPVGLLEKAVPLFSTNEYAHTLQFMTEVLLADLYTAKIVDTHKNKLIFLDPEILTKLELALSSGDEADKMVLFKALLRNSGERFFDRNQNRACELFQKHAEEWQFKVLSGMRAIGRAWASRGGGWASEVTETQWDGFFKGLAEARKDLTRSWQLRPDRPEAAALMIKVVIGENDSPDNERIWFDRAVSARFDYRTAYENYRTAILPRWGGSHEEMIEFAEECLHTKRYDTQIPMFYADVISTISSEQDNGYGIYEDDEVYANLKQVYNGYISEPTQGAWKEYFQTRYFFAAASGRHIDEAYALLKTLNYKLDTAGSGSLDRDEWIRYVCISASPQQKEIRHADSLFKKNQASKALPIYEKVLPLLKEEVVSNHVKDQIAAAGMEAKIENGEWVDFLPKNDFAGWNREVGKWTINSDGSLQVEARDDGMLLVNKARVGPNFEIRGQIEFVSSSNDEFQGGIVFGYPKISARKWKSFRIKTNRREGQVAGFSQHFYALERSIPIAVQTTNTFYVKCLDGVLSAEVNGKGIVDNDPVGKGYVTDADSNVGLGAYYDVNVSDLRYRNVQLRKLKGSGRVAEKTSAKK